MENLLKFFDELKSLINSSVDKPFIDISIHVINACSQDNLRNIFLVDPKSDNALDVIRIGVEKIQSIDEEVKGRVDELINKFIVEMEAVRVRKFRYRDSTISATNWTGISLDEAKRQVTDANVIIATIGAMIAASIAYFFESPIPSYVWGVVVGLIIFVILVYSRAYKYKESKTNLLWENSSKNIEDFGKLAKYRMNLMVALEGIVSNNKAILAKELINKLENNKTKQDVNLFFDCIKYPIRRDVCKLMFGYDGVYEDSFKYDGFIFNISVVSKIDHYIRNYDIELASLNNSTMSRLVRSKSL